MDDKIKIGISSCLLGNKVRYNGGHTLDHFLVDVLGQYVEYIPVCPEVEVGLSTPRETLRLVKVDGHDSPRLMFRESKEDITERMLEWADRRLDFLENKELCGYVFKTKSPSSGMDRIKIYNQKGGVIARNGTGIFAGAFMNRFPLLPVEDEGRLNDVGIRENFIVRIFTYHRWRTILKKNTGTGAVVDFHTRNKLLFMSHHPDMARQMGKFVAQAKTLPLPEFLKGYEELAMKCMTYRATVKKHANVLFHMMGYFKTNLEPDEKQELIEVIDDFRQELVPLVVPLTLIKHYVRKYDQPYLKQQTYLNPHPMELKLRNHA